MTRELWLVRHGETEWSVAGRFCGRSDPPLTERGRAQARELRPALRDRAFDSFLSSPAARSVETARLAYGEPAVDARLHELDFGDVEGVTWTECSDDLRRKLADYETFEAPNGESVAQLAERVTELLDELGGGRHLVFTHGGVIRLLLGRVGETGFPGLGTITRVTL